ncbi:MAG: exo-alpha-sialidase [Saprospiraceae bacterium]
MNKLLLLFLALCLLTNAIAQNQNISKGNVFEGEPFLAVNPVNPKNLVVAWMGFVFNSGSGLTIKVKSSFDGGLTWSNTLRMPHLEPTYKSADPTMAFDAQGNLFLAYIDYRQNPDSGGVYLFKSANGGLAWGDPVKMIDALADADRYPIDRPFLAVNEAGNKLYLTTKPAPWVAAPNRPYVIRSSDGGATWSPWRYLDSTGYLTGNFIVAPLATPACTGNAVRAVYPSYVPSQNLKPQFIIANSQDGGNSFDYHTVYDGNSSPATNDTAKLAYQLVQDPTDANHLVFVFFNNLFGDIDIFMTETHNGGMDWTAPLRVNDDAPGNGKMQDMVWASFDTDGDLVVTWRDRRNASGSGYATASAFYAAFRDKDSLYFAPNFALSDVQVDYNPILAESGNDFMSVILRQDTISAVWANTRDGSLDVWFARMSARSGSISGIALIESTSTLVEVSPNPGSGLFQVRTTDGASIDELVVFDARGELVLRIQNGSDTMVADLSEQPVGVYLLNVYSNNRKGMIKVIKQ